MTSKKCSIPECGRPVLARKYCKRHYERWRRHGDPHICLKNLSDRGAPMRWIRNHVAFACDECLIWPFARFPDGRAHMNPGKPSRVMCQLAHGNPPTNKHQAAHSCGNAHGACVNPRHLRWATPKENNADKVKHETLLMGEQLPQSKLTEKQISEIRSLGGALLQKDIAERFGVTQQHIHRILRKTAWRHV